jgi:hypothetical protein
MYKSDLIANNSEVFLAKLYLQLPFTFSSPLKSPCIDENKH